MKLFSHSTSLILVFLAVLSTSCQTAKFSTALDQYQRGEYFEAASTFKRVYRKTDARDNRARKGEVAWYIGMCYEKLMIPQQAASGFQNAARYGYEDTSLRFHEAQALHRAGRYREAEKAYKAYLEVCPDDKLAINGLESCQKAADWKEAFTRYEVKRFAAASGRRADFSPAVFGENDEVLYWTSSSDKSKGDKKSPITGTKYCDIWMLQQDDKGKWGRPQEVNGSINTDGDEGTPCFSADGSTMYYTAAGGEGQAEVPHIYAAKRADASWSKGSMITFSKDTISLYAHPAASPDGKWLYFVSNMPGGEGGLDLWRARLKSPTEVEYIENAGPRLNTAGNEMFPSFSPDGILYFSTDGRESLGGLDLYSAREDEWGTWHLEHLPVPLNSAGDDFGMSFFRHSHEDQKGYFSSNRNQGKGYDNIYEFVLPRLKITISGYVLDTDEQPIAEAIVRVVGRDGKNYKTLSKPDGSYFTEIERSTEYVLMAGGEGYLNRKAQFTTDSAEEDADYEIDFHLASISVPVLIDNIFYDYNSARLREESIPSLDDLVSLLNDNPYCAIELASHTDRVGSQAFNLDLSQRRAQSVVDYLVEKGIDPARLSPVGYGKEQPKVVTEALAKQYEFLTEGQVLTEEFVNGLTPEEREIADQINRRTEFQVRSTTWGIE